MSYFSIFLFICITLWNSREIFWKDPPWRPLFWKIRPPPSEKIIGPPPLGFWNSPTYGGKLSYLNHILLFFRRPNIQGYNSTEECLCWNLWPRRRWTGRKTCKYSKLKKSLSPRIPWRSFDQNLWPFMTYCLNCLNIVCATSLHFYCWIHCHTTKQGIISNQGLHNCECLCWNSKS